MRAWLPTGCSVDPHWTEPRRGARICAAQRPPHSLQTAGVCDTVVLKEKNMGNTPLPANSGANSA